jgi:hypothetical protein
MQREVRTRSMLTIVTGTVSGGVITLPSDFRGVQSLRMTIGGLDREIYPLPPGRYADDAVAYVPIGYIAQGNTLQVIGGSDGYAYTLTYWQAIPALSASNTTNWMLTAHPGLYLYATLVEASPYLRDNDQVIVWAQQYKSISAAIQSQDEDDRYGNAPGISVRVP